MLRDNDKDSGHEDLFRQRLDNIIDMKHELVELSLLINWEGLSADFSQYYCLENGRPGEPIRLMAGLQLLKSLKGLSDEEVCSVWRENPYYQYFCGEDYFQYDFPVRPESLSIFRGRIGESGLERLLEETVNLGLKSGTVSKKDMERVVIDSTVQEKAIKFPTDTHLCHKAREELLKLARSHDVKIRQSYVRKSKEAVFMANRYLSAKQMKRGRKMIQKVRNYLGRVMRDCERAIVRDASLGKVFEEALAKAAQIYAQAGDKKMTHKLYAWHAPEVECIAKGKSHKKYEFGCKASYTTTHASNFIVGAKAFHGKPYDGHTLKTALNQVKRLTGVTPKEAYGDQHYKNHGIDPEETQVIISRQKRGITKAQMKRRKRRNAVEPIIGHCKNDRKVGPRNWLQGKQGDQINAIAMAIGYNLRKILKEISLWLGYQIIICRYFVTGKINQTQNQLF